MATDSRRLTALDGMALVAAVATGFALLRVTWAGFWPTRLRLAARGERPALAYIEAAARQAVGAGPPWCSA